MEQTKYHYDAIVRGVHDGDTCTVDIDAGLNIWAHGEKIRLHRIDAPELKGDTREAGLRSRDFLRAQIDGKTILLQTLKDPKDKYGRYLGEIWLQNESGEWININDLMVKQGHAIYREY